MRKAASKIVAKPSAKPKRKVARPKPLSEDDRLAEHLKQAEHHLIEAVTLFSGPRKVARRVGYQSRLENAQEAITGLYREELVRIRGPISRRGRK
jgi:hypothetical protein